MWGRGLIGGLAWSSRVAIGRSVGWAGGFLGESMGPLSDPRPTFTGELYDLDASSLQLKVLQYVSPYALPLCSVLE